MSTTTEPLHWHNAQADKPQTCETVLCWGAEGFFCGYWDEGLDGWIGCESGGSVTGVKYWSAPQGPPEPATPHVKTAAEMRLDAAHDMTCVGAFARARPGAAS